MIENLFTFVRTLGNQRIQGKKFFVTQVGLLGTVSDNSGSIGTAGKVLSSTGSGVSWITVGTGSSDVDVLNDLSDVVISTATEGQLLRFNGTSWVNWTHPFLTSSSTLGDLFNVGNSADGANNGDILRFDEAAGLWVADEFPSFTESDTLDSVTDRGTTTTNSITVGGLSTSGTVTAAVVTTPLIEREGVLTINSEEQVDQGEPNPNLLYVSWFGDNKFVINADGYAIASTGYKVTGGTASGFLKANGTIDTSTYLTSYTETQTLDAVTDLGSTTTNNISVGGLTSTSVSTPIVQSNNGVLTITADSSGSLQPEQGDPAVKVLSFKWSTTEFGFLDTDGKIAFQGFKTPTGTASGFLKANGTVDTSAYITEIEYLDDIGDVVISTPATGDVLTFDGSEWVNSPIDSADYVSKVQHEVKAGVAITKGQALYVTGADGTNIVVGKASNVSEAMSSKTIGLAAASAAVNGKFFVITEGLLAGLNTSAANVGDAVWLGVNGALIFGLTNKPVAPAHLVYIGVVTRKNANNGEIFISIQNGFELKELHDVLINGVTAGQLIRREADGLWKNWTPNYITANSVDTLLNKTIPLGTGIYEIFAIDDISGFAGQTDIPIYQDGIDKGGTINISEELIISVSNSGIGYYNGAVTTSGGTRFVISVNGNTLTGTLAEFNVALTDGTFATESYVGTQIANLVDSAPATLDTLNELAAALGDDANFATTVTTSIATKQPQLNGTGFVKASGTTISYDNSTYLTSESDPIFTGSAAYGITNENLSEWSQAYGWSDHSTFGYLTSESDPVFTGSVAYTITSENITNWDTAFSWGNHADYGYLTTLPDHNHDDRYYTESESDTKFYLATNPSDYQTTTGTVANIASGTISNLNAAWTAPGSSIANGFVVYRYGSSSTNQPVVADNANWLINIYSHPAEGVSSYGHQLAAANGNNIYFRSVSNGTFSGWHKFWSTNDFSSATFDNWNAAYNNTITAASFATATGILTLTQQDLGTVTVNLDGRYLTSASDSQTLSWDKPSITLSISNGNSIALEGLATEEFVTGQGYITGISFADVSSKPTTIAGYGITDAITTANIGSQSVLYADSSGNSNLLKSLGSYVWSSSTNGRDFQQGLQVSFVSNNEGYQSYGSVVRLHTYPNDGASAELYFPYSEQYGGNSMQYRLGLYHNAGWSSWKTVVDSENIGEYALTSLPAHNHDDRYYTETESDARYPLSRGTLGTTTNVGDATGFGNNLASGTYTRNYVGHGGQVWVSHDTGGSVGNFALEVTYYGAMYVHTNVDSSSWATKQIWTSDTFANNSSNWNTAFGWGNHAGANYIVRGSTQSPGSWTEATKFQSAGDIGTETSSAHSLQIYSAEGNDAFMAFHISSDFAVFFGLDNTTNRLYTGGWSDGNNKYQLWDSRDFSSTNISNWNTAYGWGNHSGLYLGLNSKAADSELIDGIDSSSILWGNARGTNDSVTTDADGLDKTGFYTSSAFVTRPEGVDNWMYIQHIKLYNDNSHYQKQIGYDTYDDRMWVRTKSGNTWSSWKAILTSENIGEYTLTSLPAHTHTIADVTGLQTALDGKLSAESDTLDSVTGRGATTSNLITITSSDVGLKVQENGTSTAWRGRIGSFNSSADKSSFLGNYTGRAGVFGHNNALSAWDDLWVNTLGIYGQGNLYLSWNTYVKGNSNDTNYPIIHSGNISSQSVNFATSSGNSSTTDQTVFGSLFINDAAVATKEFVTSQGYLTSLPAHNHDDRYYTETESDSRYVNTSGDTMTGNLTLKYSTADSSDYEGLMFAPYSDAEGLNDYIIKAGSDRGVFGRKSFGWHVHTESAFGVYSNDWEKLFGVEGGTGNTQVFGSLTVSGSITENSSIRYKKDVVDIESASAKVEKLRPVRYKKIRDESEEIGLIAEDVAELFPEVVKYDNEGRPDGVNYSRLSVILLKAVQELTERVNKLENK
jgi:hypothetical protein